MRGVYKKNSFIQDNQRNTFVCSFWQMVWSGKLEWKSDLFMVLLWQHKKISGSKGYYSSHYLARSK